MFEILEPILKDKPGFHITWELTLKCNLDCSYCDSNGHDNSVPHPDTEECLKTLDFLLKYVDLYMTYKAPQHRSAILNVFGGEAIYHPGFVTILEEARKRYEQYRNKWYLSIHCVTNAVAAEHTWKKILDNVDSFTISYHTESRSDQQQQVRNNILLLKETGKWYQCSILMHPKHFDNNLEMIEWCKDNNIPYLPRQLDQHKDSEDFKYQPEQIVWFDNLYKKKETKTISVLEVKEEKTNISEVGRACCGGTGFCVDQDTDNSTFFIPDNKFEGWSCSVNWFFVFVKQTERAIYVNKDCKMNFNGEVAPIGYLDDAEHILQDLEINLTNNTMPVIKCKKRACWCGLCAPKARTEDLYNTMMLSNYIIPQQIEV